MKSKFEELVAAVNISPLSTDILHQIVHILKQQTDESILSFVSQSFLPLLALQQWAWQLLSQSSNQWINQPYYQELFHTLASFNKKLIFNDNIEVDTKASLLFSITVDQINSIFQQIEQSNDDNNPFITIVSMRFDNNSFFLHEYPHCSIPTVIDHMNYYIARYYMMSKQFKFYLSQLRQSPLAQSVFTAKLLFYIRTSTFSIFSYFAAKGLNLPYTAKELLYLIDDNYLQIIHVHSRFVSSWSKELLACIAPVVSLVVACYHLVDEKNRTVIKTLFPTEQVLCDHIQELIHIIGYKPFHTQIKAMRSNDETILIDLILMILRIIIRTQNINWFFRSDTTIQHVLSTVAETSFYDEICLCAYTILGTVLTDEQLKELKIADSMTGFFFNMLEQAWHHPSKEYKHKSISSLLQDFQILSKNDSVQQKTADLNKIPLFIDICEYYSMTYHILWALSFNQDIQQQLHSSPSFMSKLSHQAKECDNEQMRKIIHGILWNLEINRQNRSISENGDGTSFDIMISYSHKDKVLCKQIYEELIKSGYRVWIDFDQMRGNIMDAMAQAIERSHTILICMSEDYRKSNYCRAEAHYAFQRQLKIVPVLLQQHYKPDGWLLFLIGQLLYVDFTKYEFIRAMEMLMQELKANDIIEPNASPVHPKEDTSVASPASLSKTSSSSILSQNILSWTQTQVQQWLVEHNLIQMSHLLADCDGRSLIYLRKCMKHGELRCILNSLQEDCLRRTNQNLSYIELSCFLSLMDQQKRLLQSTSENTSNTKNNS